MSQGKIIPLIAAAKREAETTAHAELRQLMDAIDSEIDALQARLDAKLAEITAVDKDFGERLAQAVERITKLEKGG